MRSAAEEGKMAEPAASTELNCWGSVASASCRERQGGRRGGRPARGGGLPALCRGPAVCRHIPFTFHLCFTLINKINNNNKISFDNKQQCILTQIS